MKRFYTMFYFKSCYDFGKLSVTYNTFIDESVHYGNRIHEAREHERFSKRYLTSWWW